MRGLLMLRRGPAREPSQRDLQLRQMKDDGLAVLEKEGPEVAVKFVTQAVNREAYPLLDYEMSAFGPLMEGTIIVRDGADPERVRRWIEGWR